MEVGGNESRHFCCKASCEEPSDRVVLADSGVHLDGSQDQVEEEKKQKDGEKVLEVELKLKLGSFRRR